MNAKSIIVLVVCIAAFRFMFPVGKENDDAWLKRAMAHEQTLVGQMYGDFRADRVFRGEGKSITFEFTHQLYNREDLTMTSEAIEAQLQPALRNMMAQKPEVKQYTDRGIKINVNLYSRDGRMMAAMTL